MDVDSPPLRDVANPHLKEVTNKPNNTQVPSVQCCYHLGSHTDLRRPFTGIDDFKFEDFRKEILVLFHIYGITEESDRINVILKNMSGGVQDYALAYIEPSFKPNLYAVLGSPAPLTNHDDLFCVLYELHGDPTDPRSAIYRHKCSQEGHSAVTEHTHQFQGIDSICDYCKAIRLAPLCAHNQTPSDPLPGSSASYRVSNPYAQATPVQPPQPAPPVNAAPLTPPMEYPSLDNISLQQFIKAIQASQGNTFNSSRPNNRPNDRHDQTRSFRSTRSSIRCYNCSGYGHIAVHCPSPPLSETRMY